MKKALLLSVLFLLSSQLEGFSQAAAAIKKSARGVAGQKAPPKTGQQSGGGGSTSATRTYRPTPTRIPNRTKTPIRQIQSALSFIKMKRELGDEHREKLAAGMVSAADASGAKVSPEAITKISYTVADAVNKYKLSYSKQKQLSEALLITMGAAGFSDSETKFYIGKVRDSFAGTDASAEELNQITKALSNIIAEQKKSSAK
ncbi:MAG: hypothetical protein ACPGVU_25265 [Limisphaerales bacterium]